MTAGAVVVGVDGSARSDAAVLWAADEAAARRVRLLVLHAINTDSIGIWSVSRTLRDELRDAVEPLVDRSIELARARHPDLVVYGRALVGPPGRLLRLMTRHAQLVVVGRDGRGALARAWLGGVPDRLLADAACPAVSVASAPSSARGHVQRIVVGCAFDDRDEATLQWAFELAANRGVPVFGVHAVHQPADIVLPFGQAPSYDEAVIAAEHELKRTLDTFTGRYPDVPVIAMARTGKPSDILLQVSRPGDLLVLARHHRSATSLRQLGATTAATLRGADCCVAVLPGASSHAGRTS